MPFWRISIGLILALLLGYPGARVQAADRLTVNDVNRRLVCQCGCNMVLHSCTCGVAREMNDEIRSMIAQGLTLEEILNRFQDQYGPTVLAAPPKRGFFVTAWVLPFFAILLGGGVIAWYLRRRAHAPPPPRRPSPQMSDQVVRSILDSVDR